MEPVRLSLSISLAILPSDAVSLKDAHHWLPFALHGIQNHNQCCCYYNGIIILNTMHSITSTVGIAVIMKGSGHNDTLRLRVVKTTFNSCGKPMFFAIYHTRNCNTGFTIHQKSRFTAKFG